MSIDLDEENQLILKKEGVLVQSLLTTTPISLYSPPSNRISVLEPAEMVIVNRSNQTRWVTMWIDDTGTGMANVNLLCFQVDIASKSIWTNPFRIIMDDPAGNLSFEAETDSVFNLTIFGKEYYRIP